MPITYLKIKKSKADYAHVRADISNHREQEIENEERRERLRRILESRKANDQEKVQSAAATQWYTSLLGWVHWVMTWCQPYVIHVKRLLRVHT